MMPLIKKLSKRRARQIYGACLRAEAALRRAAELYRLHRHDTAIPALDHELWAGQRSGRLVRRALKGLYRDIAGG